jgi:hypothetical protein
LLLGREGGPGHRGQRGIDHVLALVGRPCRRSTARS